ncbi:MAG: type II toxin-antitoxin system prevent-host-death family antitoxin [Treponema sp.]|nr:type II toxin-antitoxin system prevent-host-death family antitoxin [Treponema sp.]
MPNIRPVSDLRNYASVLMEVRENEPVYLTKNGRGSYAIVDIKEYEDFEKTKASLKLMYELQKGKVSGETKGWLSEEDVEKHFEEKFNK